MKLLRLLALSLLTSVTLMAQNSETISPEDQAKLDLANTYPIQSQNLADPRSYPEVNSGENRVGACWYPLDAGFITLAQNGVAVTPLTSGSLDDGYWGPINLGFNFTFYGTTYNSIYINTNGNITFGTGYTSFTPSGFPDGAGPDMIAPYWGDIDLRGTGIDNGVYYKIDGNKIIITWNQVGYYYQKTSPTNTFQIVLSDGADPWIPNGDNAQFAYDDMNWCVGDIASANNDGFDPSAGGSLTEPAATNAFGTAGAQNAGGANYYQIGLFGRDNDQYDGPAGDNDGIHSLDNACFLTDLSGLNTPPIANSFPTSTIQVCVGETYNLSTSFSAPELTQTTTTTVSNVTMDPGSWSTTIVDGNFSTQDLSVTPITADIGTHTFTYTSTDDGTPSETTTNTVTIEVIASPAPTISGTASFCDGGSSVLDAGAGYSSYLWSTGETTQTITVSTANTYSVTVTNANGCSGSDDLVVTVNANPTPSITPSGATTFCDGNSVDLDAGVYSSYSWTPNGESSQIISAAASGTYEVTVTDANGCIGIASQAVTVNTNPTPSITPSGATTFCDGNSISLDPGNGYSSYSWSPGGEATQTINVSSSNTYEVTVTDANGCTGTTSQIVTVNPNPTPSITPSGATSFCSGGSVDLDAGIGYSSYSWTPNGETVSSITANTSGTYEVTVTDANGCSGTDSEIVTVNTNPTPSITPSGATTFCDGNSVDLIADNGYSSYAWTPNGETTQTITATTDGTYEVTVTDANGCTGTASQVVTVNTNPTPNITPDGPTTFCTGDAVTLNTGIYTSYSWSTGETTQGITVNSSSDYSVTVTDANGCTGTSANETVTVNANPTATIAGSTSYCTGSSSTLDAGAGYSSYLWSTGATTQTINATTADNPISVTVTDANGCSDLSSTVTLTENTTLTPVISGPTSYCAGADVTLDAGSGYSAYSWSTGATTQTITATTADNTITVTVTDANGCIGTSADIDLVEFVNPSPSISGTLEYCEGSTTTLDAGAYNSYLWSTGATTQTVDATITDNDLTVTVTDANGCSGTSAAVTVIENTNPIVSISGDLAYCEGNSSTLDAGTHDSYLWSTGATTQTADVTIADSPVSVIVTNTDGCSSTSSSVVLTENTNPSPTISGALEYCAGTPTTLDAGAGYSSYAWSNGAITQTIDGVVAYNDLTVTVTDANGCSGTSPSVTLTENALPTVDVTGTLAYCTGNSTTLTATTGFASYSWGPGGETTESITATAGTYEVTVTDANGCEATSASVDVTENALPTPTISGILEYCEGTNTTLDAGPGYSSYAWSNTDITQTTDVSAGTYTVSVVDANGCSATSPSVEVIENANPTPSITGNLEYCIGNTTSLDAGTGYASYSWSNGDLTQLSIVSAGTYNVTVTDLNGCSGTSADVDVIENVLPTPVITGSTTYCTGSTATLSTAESYSSYTWSSTQTGPSISATEAGNPYSVTVVDANGCEATSADFSVTETSDLTPNVIGDIAYCTSDGNVTLTTDDGYFSYIWSNGATTQSSVFTIADNPISVQVSDVFGCFGTSLTVNLSENSNPTPSITGNNSYCEGDFSTLDAGAYSSYLWSTGETTQTIDATAGVISVEVTDANGCSGIDNITISENALPTPIISGTLDYCEGNNTLLDAGAGYVTYLWSNGDAIQTSSVSAGTYDVTVTDINGCSATSPSVDVTELTVTIPTVSGSTTFCTGGSTTLETSGYSTYLWSNGDNTPTTTINVAGTYSVMVTDVNGCTSTSADVDVTVNTFLTPLITGSTDYCDASSALLDGGSGYVSYLWSNGETSQTINATEADNPITVNVIDVNGCSGTTAAVNVTSQASPTVSVIGDTEYCEGGNVTLDAGAHDSYLWSNGEVTPTIVANSGTYSVTVTNAFGCSTLSNDIIISENPNPTPSISGETEFCSGSTVVLDAGTGYSSYSWSNGSMDQTAIVIGGDYTVIVEDANGCFGTSPTFTVTEFPTPFPTISGNDTICDGESTILDAGTGYTSYIWSNGNGGQQTYVNETGIYSVVVTNSFGCSNVSPDFVFTVLPSPALELTSNGPTVFCVGDVIDVTLDAGVHDNYLWNTGETSQTILVTTEGTYEVTVTNNEGCSASQSTEVVQSTLTSPNLLVNGNTTICEGEESELYLNDPYYTYMWSSGSTTPTITANYGGDYWVTVTDEYGCEKNSDTVTVVMEELPIANFNFSSPAMTIDFTDLSSNATSWEWDFDDGNTSTTQNPSHTYSESNTYWVTLIAYNGCGSDTITQGVAVKPENNIGYEDLTWNQVSIYPNPARDFFNIDLSDINEEVVIEVYNELGAIVYTSISQSEIVNIDMSRYARGVYTIRITNSYQQLDKKIVVQ